MAEYRLDVRPILEQVGGSVHASDVFELDKLVVGDETFVLTEPARFDVFISNAGEALVSTGHISAAVRATCSRCLCDFETVINGDVEGYWLRPGDTAPEDEDVTGTVDEDSSIDLEPALMAALVVEAPFAPLHEEDCAGLCATCGADLNEGPCDCGQEGVSDEHPFAALKTLLNEDATDTADEGRNDPEE